jgi:hypothetical protein
MLMSQKYFQSYFTGGNEPVLLAPVEHSVIASVVDKVGVPCHREKCLNLPSTALCQD